MAVEVDRIVAEGVVDDSVQRLEEMYQIFNRILETAIIACNARDELFIYAYTGRLTNVSRVVIPGEIEE